MNSALLAPAGFIADSRGRVTLFGRSGQIEHLRRIGLGRPERWQELLSQGSMPAAGRGATAVLDLAGTRARLKRLRRGGLLGSLWRERFPGRRRVLDNLRLPIEAARRGIPTPAPLALLVVEGPPGLFRAWMAVEEIAGARDLGAWFGGANSPPSRPELAEAMSVVRRMHEVGLDHRDLNLGNLLLRRGGEGGSVFVVDWDGARTRTGPLSFRVRLRALRRLERSAVKLFGTGEPAVRRLWYELYAAGDPQLADRLERVRLEGDLRLRLRRLGGLR